MAVRHQRSNVHVRALPLALTIQDVGNPGRMTVDGYVSAIKLPKGGPDVVPIRFWLGSGMQLTNLGQTCMMAFDSGAGDGAK